MMYGRLKQWPLNLSHNEKVSSAENYRLINWRKRAFARPLPHLKPQAIGRLWLEPNTNNGKMFGHGSSTHSPIAVVVEEASRGFPAI
jgi:hypothetical protein